MSSTNRGAVRREADFYETPSWCVKRLLEKLNLPGGRWLEPGAGEGAIIRAVDRSDVNWTALELREETRPSLLKLKPRPNVIITDAFLSVPSEAHPLHGQEFVVAFGNPPYSLAFEFVQQSLIWAQQVVFLLPMPFMTSNTRHSWLKNNMPDLFVLPDRPSFTGTGTDSVSYAWFRWTQWKQTTGSIAMLDSTPLKERKRT